MIYRIVSYSLAKLLHILYHSKMKGVKNENNHHNRNRSNFRNIRIFSYTMQQMG